MGKTVRGAKRATMKKKRRTDKHQQPVKPLDEQKLVGKPRVRRTR